MYDRVKLLRGLAAWIPELTRGTCVFATRMLFPARRPPAGAWWERPGWGVMYQVEYRPGWEWDRDYGEFNPSMLDERGRFEFNGPYCRPAAWVELSRELGVDYHIMEAKWHDGICFFDTALTDWKSDEDYAADFSRLSREAGIPFMFYYSHVFDHNPRFDDIQPDRRHTFSIIALGGQPAYEEYLIGQYRELVEGYEPDGMWMDWYWPGDGATTATFDFFRGSHPGIALGFNFSNYLAGSYARSDYTIGEAHHLDGPLVSFKRTGKMLLPVIHSAWKWSGIFRRMLGRPWELIAPAGRWWQDPGPRPDPCELLRMAAVTMASGGRFSLGATARMDGSIVPTQVEQLRMLGDWYRDRRALFSGALPLAYRGSRPPGLQVSPRGFKCIASRLGDDTLVHAVNTKGAGGPIRLTLSGGTWGDIGGARLEPGGKEIALRRSGAEVSLTVEAEDVDAVDTILRLA